MPAATKLEMSTNLRTPVLRVGVVAFDGQIDARAMDQVGNQDIFQHVQIVFAQVETYQRDDQFGEVATQAGQQSFSSSRSAVGQRFVVWTGATGKATGRRSANWRSTRR